MRNLRHSRSISSAVPSLDADGDNVRDGKRRLTLKFLLTGIIATILIGILISAGSYYVVRSWSLQMLVDHVSDEINDNVMVGFRPDQSITEPKVHSSLGNALLTVSRVKEVALYDADRSLLWSNSKSMRLTERQANQFVNVSQGRAGAVIFDRKFSAFKDWQSIFRSTQATLPFLTLLRSASGEHIAVTKVMINARQELAYARNFGISALAVLLSALWLLFYLLYRNFKKGVQTIEKQEKEMNTQIERLSNLLIINKSMQSSIKTASARAVELNEQFLRRTGADLHDGPAQMIGFAAMRLNKLSKDEAVKSLGNEFHTILEALNESLDEIRGISSGLVLPELATMSFEECLRKVVLLHGTKSDAQVTQFHAQMPDNIELPVKICAYRFVQEGLNNAERHGKAEKCRLTTSYRDGVLEVSLKDDGVGFRKSKLNTDGGHLGLMGMKDRIESIGGKFTINSELGVGTAIKFSVDLTEDS